MLMLSVIIPVYNVEDYLQECIDSVLNQTYHCELEIILINDGSTDKSGLICDRYSARDNRIRVIHKENGGLSSARNIGIKAAIGDYIAFLDSDDFWIENTIHHYIKAAKDTQADIIIGNAIRCIASTHKMSPYPNNIKANVNLIKTEDIIYDILDPSNQFQWHVWKNLYRTEFIKANDMYFKNGLLFEDVEWLPRVLSLAKNIEIINKIFVCYRYQRINSITMDNTKRAKRLEDMLEVIHSLSSYFNGINMNQKLKKRFYMNFSKTYIYVFLRQALLYDKKSKALLKRYAYYIHYYKGKYSRTIKILVNILGFDKACIIINKVGKIAFIKKDRSKKS